MIPSHSLSGYSNGTFRVTKFSRTGEWPILTQAKLTTVTIRAVRFHPNNPNQFVVSADNSFLKLYDLRYFKQKEGCQPVVNYAEHVSTHQVHQINIDSTTGLLVSSGSDNVVRFWNSATGKLVHQFSPYSEELNPKYYPVHVAYSGEFCLDDSGVTRDALLTIYGPNVRMYYAPTNEIDGLEA